MPLGTDFNFSRYRSSARGGFYESFFQRANHPTKPLAFWIRYTLFSPRGRPADAIGELWAIYFNGETRAHVAVKREVPFARCAFDSSAFGVRIDDAELVPGHLSGAAASGPHRLQWDLTFQGDAAPLFLLPPRAYAAALPKAKSLVGVPLATFTGGLTVDGQRITIDRWIGSQNHNWGTRHTDWYAWGQVAGFDDAPDTFLELATARMKVGPLWTPAITLLVLRHAGEEIRLNRIRHALRASADVDYFRWTFRAGDERVSVAGRVDGTPDAFVALRYLNPPGGTKYCLNSKIASCELTITWHGNAARPPVTLRSASRAAFEILTDDARHGLTPRV